MNFPTRFAALLRMFSIFRPARIVAFSLAVLLTAGTMPFSVKGQGNRMDPRTGNPNARPGDDFNTRERRFNNTKPVGDRPQVQVEPANPPMSDADRHARISRFKLASTESRRPAETSSTAKAQTATDLSFRVGEKRPVVIIPEDAQGNTVHGLAIQWSSSAPAVLNIAPDGMAEAVSPGSATLTASAGYFSQTLQVMVDSLPDVPASAQVFGKGTQARPAVFKRSHVAVRKAALQQNPQLPQWTEEEIQSFSPSYNPAGTQLSKAGGRAPISPTPPPANPDGAEPGGNENFTFDYPLAGLSGRGMSAGVSLFYNSRVWKRFDLSTGPPEVRFEPEQAGSIGTGFATGFGYGMTSSAANGASGSAGFCFAPTHETLAWNKFLPHRISPEVARTSPPSPSMILFMVTRPRENDGDSLG